MNKKQASNQITIPGFIWAIAVILILCVVFLFVVQMPFAQKIDKYNADHESAQSQITMYENYLSRAEEVEAYIAEMKEKYNEESKKLFVNATQSPADIQEMVHQLNIQLDNVSVNEGGIDGAGRTSSTGDPLYVTNVNMNFSGTQADLLSILDYFELESDGSYYVENLSVSPQDAAETSGASRTTVTDQKYSITLGLSLYFFPQKIEEVSNAPIVSGSDAAVSVTSTASASSAA